MGARYPIGIDDFRKLRESGLEYVDKSDLIIGLLEDPGTEVFLFPRPRRFGKSLNLSMLRWFLEKRDEDLSHLFTGLRVWDAGPGCRAHFQRHPVISLTFKDVKASSYEVFRGRVREKIERLFDEHRTLLEGGLLSRREARRYEAVLDATAGDAVYENALLDLASYLHRQHGERVVILIDEYDEPIHAGYVGGYAPQALDFFRSFLGSGLKSNPHLFKGVLTGILRVARESIFSGLNNLAVYSILRPEFSACFGFTEAEVEALLRSAGQSDHLETVRRWYNGYLFGGAPPRASTIYNPWSVLNFLRSEDKLPRGYWVSTSSNDLVREQLTRHAADLEADLLALLEGGSLEKPIDENVALGELDHTRAALWSLLLFAGYLKAEAMPVAPGEAPRYQLSIPDREVREVYTSTFKRWIEARMPEGERDTDRLVAALLEGDEERLQTLLQRLLTNLLSFYDPGTVDPWRVYQGFMVGLLAVLEPFYQVRSNRESGSGRPDLLVRPTRPGRPGAVLELKTFDSSRRSAEEVLREALLQCERHDYPAELRAADADPIQVWAVAFDGKRVWVKRG